MTFGPLADTKFDPRNQPAARVEQPTPQEREIQYNDEMHGRLISLVAAVNVLSLCDGEYRAKIRTPQMPAGLINAWEHVNAMIVKAEKHMRTRNAPAAPVVAQRELEKSAFVIGVGFGYGACQHGKSEALTIQQAEEKWPEIQKEIRAASQRTEGEGQHDNK